MKAVEPAASNRLSVQDKKQSKNGSAGVQSAEFEKQVRLLMPSQSGKNVREPELFAGLIAYQLQNAGGQAALRTYEATFDKCASSDRGQGERGVVYAANRALKETRLSGAITQEEAQMIRARAFGAAHTEPGTYRFDLSKKENTDQALAAAGEKMRAFENGEHALTRPERRAMEQNE